MADVERLQNELREILEELKPLVPGSRAYALLEGQRTTIEAQLIGAGAIAQGDGATALGAGAFLINGDVTINNHPDPEAAKHAKALTTYLKRLSRACLSLPLAALGGEESAESEVTLDKVYIALNTTHFRRVPLVGLFKAGSKLNFQNSRSYPITALEAASAYPRIVLLGDPGAGKSTFIKKLLAWQADASQGQIASPEGFSTKLIPVLMDLRNLAPRLTLLQVEGVSAQKRDDLLIETVWEQLISDLGSECADFASALQIALQSGECLLALDGLDEVPYDLRGRVRQTVNVLLKRYPLQRVIVTCRIRSYVGESILSNFANYTLAPFNEEQIGNFIQGWYNTQHTLGRISESWAKERMRDLLDAVYDTDLRELSSNPLLLTTMSIIHQREVGLPRERVRLYSLAVEILLRRWQKHKVGDAALAEFLRDDLKLRAVMEALAYTVHRFSAKSGESATLLRKDAIELLERAEYLGDLRLAGEFLDYVDQRAGLLLGYGGELNKPTAYSFPHRTFQEYLAGGYLAGQRDRVRAFMGHAVEADNWNLVVQLAFEELFYIRRATNELLDLAYQLAPVFKQDSQSERVFLWAGQITALVGRTVVERDSHPGGGLAFLEKMRAGLLQIMTGNSQPPFERAEAGHALAKLGDPRPEVLTSKQMAFCYVPAGSFLFDEGRFQKEVELDAFWIGKYPVTNAQFDEFVVAGGYKNPIYWSEAIKDNCWSESGFQGSWQWDNELRFTSNDFGEPFSLPSYPVVGISWYEALAYTHWVSEQLPAVSAQWVFNNNEDIFREQNRLGKLQVILPSHEQWEKAAQGTDGRKYPWGGEFDANKANTKKTGINKTTAVGCFPGGETPYGLLDASGNVFEWVSEQMGMRGGSFKDEPDTVRCSGRGMAFRADYTSNNVGFRFVIAYL